MGADINRDSHSKHDFNNLATQANARLYEESCQKFGKQNVDAGGFNKKDLAEMTAVAILGPGACQALGHERTKVAGAAMVSIVSPALIGGLEEGKKHVQERPMETVHNGSGNILIGAAGSALLRINPLVATGLAVCGGGLFINDQLNSPRNKERNSNLSNVLSNLNKMDNSELLQACMKLKPYLGPDAYEATFVTATSSLGLKPGHQLGTAIKPNLTTEAIAAQTKQLATMLSSAVDGFAVKQPRLATAGVMLSEKLDHNFEKPKFRWPWTKREEVPAKTVLNDLDELIAANPDEAYLYQTRARENMLLGEMYQNRPSFEEALVDIEHYLQMKPNEPHGLLDRAKVYLELGNREKAMNDFCKAIPLAKIGDESFGESLTKLEVRLNPHHDLSEAQVARALTPKAFPNESKPAHLDQLNRIRDAKLARFFGYDVKSMNEPTPAHLSQLKRDYQQFNQLCGEEKLRNQILLTKSGDSGAIGSSNCLLDKLNRVDVAFKDRIFRTRSQVEPDKLLAELHQELEKTHISLVESRDPKLNHRVEDLHNDIAWVKQHRSNKQP